MSALICGSMAYDTIMVFHDHFKNHIIPDKVHMLNVSFLVPEMRRETGGCAGNIAYNLKLLGGEGKIMATVGHDFAPYAAWLEKCGIVTTHIREIGNTYTAQAFITTDRDDNQITAFHPGAMSFAHENRVEEAEEITIGIVAPDGREGMLEHASQFAETGIPFIFDPGQGLPMFDGDDLLRFVEQASWVAVNDYEAQLLEERTGKSPHELAQMVEALIVTRGAKGSVIYTAKHRYEIPAVPAREVVDPTGCGDAYRAGLLYGLMNKMDWETTGRIASLMGAIKIGHHGTQNHRFAAEEFKARFHETFGFYF
ncbi:MAG: carbohydrate kinase family protein [Gammaproteobacteria bacterium]|nr:carbohydrate kinase family protein [Gammaproteobacteria bacterium]